MRIVHRRTGATVNTSKAFAERRSARWSVPGGPSSSDTKPTWVDHAVAQGMDRAEAEASTKADLMERFGG